MCHNGEPSFQLLVRRRSERHPQTMRRTVNLVRRNLYRCLLAAGQRRHIVLHMKDRVARCAEALDFEPHIGQCVSRIPDHQAQSLGAQEPITAPGRLRAKVQILRTLAAPKARRRSGRPGMPNASDHRRVGLERATAMSAKAGNGRAGRPTLRTSPLHHILHPTPAFRGSTANAPATGPQLTA